jgi:hypothetical protein
VIYEIDDDRKVVIVHRVQHRRVARVGRDGGGHPVHGNEWPRLSLAQSACQGGRLNEVSAVR